MTATASTLFESCLALADIVDLGQDHFIERQLVERAFQREHPRVPSNAVSSTSAVDSDPYANSSNDVASTSAISDSFSCPGCTLWQTDDSEIEGGGSEGMNDD